VDGNSYYRTKKERSSDMELNNTKKALKNIATEGKATVVHFGKFVKAITFDTPKALVGDVRIDRAQVRQARALIKAGLVPPQTTEPQQ
jgi:hypothetical protein